MKFWCDGSSVGLKAGHPVIGWSAVCDRGVLVARSKDGGTNVNAEMLAIKDLLQNLNAYHMSWLDGGEPVQVVTDSKTAIQIIEGCGKWPDEYDPKKSENYRIAHEVQRLISEVQKRSGSAVELIHVNGHEKDLGNNFADWVAQTQSNQLYERLYGDR